MSKKQSNPKQPPNAVRPTPPPGPPPIGGVMFSRDATVPDLCQKCRWHMPNDHCASIHERFGGPCLPCAQANATGACLHFKDREDKS